LFYYWWALRVDSLTYPPALLQVGGERERERERERESIGR